MGEAAKIRPTDDPGVREIQPAPPARPGRAAAPRVAAIDILRGFVMVLMTVDHASSAFNRGRLMTDSHFMFAAGTPLPAAQFLTRWITHLCAPTFVALAGTALAISTESRRAKGEPEASIDRHIALRGILLVVFEIGWMSWAMLEPGKVLLQVLYAIGVSLVCMTFFRRLGDRALLTLGVSIVLGSELVLGLLDAAGVSATLPAALTFGGGFFFERRLIVAYPAIPWLGMMCLGWALGRRLLAWRAAGEDAARLAARALAGAGLTGIALFAIVRAHNGYGNMLLLRESGDVIQWLHVSKYPPSITYVGLELGIAALLLAGLMRLGARMPRALEPLRLLGQTALFYYLLHIHVLELVARVTGWHKSLGVLSSYVAALAVLVALYPACAWYRRYKAAHPNGWARWI